MCKYYSLAARRPPISTLCPYTTALPIYAVAPRVGRGRRRRARPLPRRLVTGPQRPVLRHHEPPVGADGAVDALRSEEHTSELQSRRDVVCRLLLEKKTDYVV